MVTKKAVAKKAAAKKAKPKPKGGARPGAGRKPGPAHTKTRQTADEYMKSGKITPLEYMLNTMTSTDDALQKDYRAGKIDAEIYYAKLAESQRRRDRAAEQAAPYLHAKLQSVTVGGDGPDGSIPINLSVTFVKP